MGESLKGTIKTSVFSNCLKLAGITPLHKKGRKDNKKTIEYQARIEGVTIAAAAVVKIFRYFVGII